MNERFENVRVEGSVEILGSSIYDPEVSVVELRKRVGMVFQRPNPLPLSIYDNVAFGLRVHSPRRSLYKNDIDAAVEKALQEVFLLDSVKDKLHRKGTVLQLEQQQKLCIARLLPLKPEVLLMDEPCSALDAAGTEAVEELLLSLRGHYTIVIVTHNMAQARRISDECIYMLNGELIEHGKTANLFLNPKDKRTEEYIEGRYG
jgi:phosphate transport system ATP-binding protein